MMTPQDNQYLLTVIEEEFNINKYLFMLYENKQVTGFSFHGTNHNKVFIRGNGDEVIFSFGNNKGEETGFVSMNLNTCEHLLNYLHSFHIKENGYRSKGDIYENFVKEELPLVKEYLCHYNNIECTMDVHEELFMPNKYGINHKLSIGSILNWSMEEEIASKETINIIGSMSIPITLQKEENYWVHFGLYIPNWDIKKYPIINNAFIFKDYDDKMKNKSVSTIEELIDQTSTIYPSISKNLMYKKLNNKIPNKNSTLTKRKI